MHFLCTSATLWRTLRSPSPGPADHTSPVGWDHHDRPACFAGPGRSSHGGVLRCRRNTRSPGCRCTTRLTSRVSRPERRTSPRRRSRPLRKHRLSSYWYPFRVLSPDGERLDHLFEGTTHLFEGTTFDDALARPPLRHARSISCLPERSGPRVNAPGSKWRDQTRLRATAGEAFATLG